MKRILISLILVGLAAGLLHVHNIAVRTPIQEQGLVQVIQTVEQSVVYIEAHDYEGNRIWSGSGVVISEDGLVLTASHVVGGVHRFKIVFPDGNIFYSEKSWCRPEISDVGFIQLDVSGLSVSYLGTSADLRKGEDIFIIGCPFGYELRFTVTKGIVSGLDRDCEGFFGKKLILQVDAQSWPGNSGGPVYDMEGKIVGILVGGYYGADGISLCIPVDIISDLLKLYNVEQEVY